jgi:alpha-ketoglutarate-dependent taurine dioxygenase
MHTRTATLDAPHWTAENTFTRIQVVQVDESSRTVLEWLTDNRDELRAGLATGGAYLLRGFGDEVDTFHQVVATVGEELLEYSERSTPRTAVGRNIYTSTEYPAEQPIPMHNENSYSHRWPATLYFFCHTAARTGGMTPLADSRAVYRQLCPATRELFDGGVLYTRNFRGGLGLSWQEAFQTEDRAQVEEYCRRHGHDFEWTDDGLRTRHLRPAFVREPVTGEQVWFNQANLFHVASLEPEIREAIMELGEENLPRNAYLGDGSPIPDDVIEEIESVYAATSLAMPWTSGDIMMVNNMLMAHGRRPYTGARRILVAMS